MCFVSPCLSLMSTSYMYEATDSMLPPSYHTPLLLINSLGRSLV